MLITMASSEAIWSGSTLFLKAMPIWFSRTRVNTPRNVCHGYLFSVNKSEKEPFVTYHTASCRDSLELQILLNLKTFGNKCCSYNVDSKCIIQNRPQKNLKITQPCVLGYSLLQNKMNLFLKCCFLLCLLCLSRMQFVLLSCFPLM